MARYTVSQQCSPGTTARPCIAILSTASVTPVVREVKVVNRVATACTYELVRFTGGTAGADIAELKHRYDAPAATSLAKTLWTADVTTVDERIELFELGAAVGAGEVAVFGDVGLQGVVGATKGIGLVLVGSAPASGPTIKLTWDE